MIKRLFAPAKKDGTVVEFLPDADEMERTPVPPYARKTLHVLLTAFVVFGLWATFSEIDQVVVAHGKLINPTPNVVLQPLETS
ncbi:MAG TPA: HlyD family type I secretion periplasmic adaptor subunit, partial [Burkholderiaceae bacterium]